MSNLKFALCLPRVNRPIDTGGGYINIVRLAQLLSEQTEAQLVSYREREDGVWYLPDVEQKLIGEQYAIVLTWGQDVTPQIDRFHGKLPIVYYHQGIDFGIEITPDTPILCLSKWLLAHAQEKWPSNPQFYLPPVMGSDCRNTGMERDIDVLVVRRKLPPYVTDTLLPLLQDQCRIRLIDEFISREELFTLFNRAKVYLYSYAPQRTNHSPTGWRAMEGFGMQPLEAMMCGCTVFSNLRGGLSDFIEPWSHGYRLESHSPEWDARQILNAVRHYPQAGQAEQEEHLYSHYGEAAAHKRVEQLLEFLDEYFTFAQRHPARPQDFRFPEPITRLQRVREAVIGKLYRWKRQLTKKA